MSLKEEWHRVRNKSGWKRLFARLRRISLHDLWPKIRSMRTGALIELQQMLIEEIQRRMDEEE